MLGRYDNFPATMHRIDNFTSTLTTKQLQQRLIQVLYELNKKTFSFEEAANPTIPDCTVNFEYGLAEDDGFNFIDEAETKKAFVVLKKGRLQTIDFFCAIRYYRISAMKKTALKFDYYMIRTIFGSNTVELQISHQRGPRYISPEDLTTFMVNKVNEASQRKVLKQIIDPS